eukprot:m.256821 g.256821  ORF g.256821 m.256821 type:complete len:483 (-) comp34732_c0_seq1:283-1731(-)
MAAETIHADTIQVSPRAHPNITDWTNADVLTWAKTLHLSQDSVEKLKSSEITGQEIIKMSRDDMNEAGIDSALEQARLLGHVHLLNEENEGVPVPDDTTTTTTKNTDDAEVSTQDEATPIANEPTNETEQVETESTEKEPEKTEPKEKEDDSTVVENDGADAAVKEKEEIPDDGDRMRLKSIAGPVIPDKEQLRRLRERVWNLFCQDEVAGRTNRLYIEGDLMKFNSKGWGNADRRRFILLDTSFLWCLVTSRGPSMDQDNMVLKGRLDIGEFSVIDLADGSKQGRKVLSNAFKIFNIHKEKWYSLVCDTNEEKQKWMDAFVKAGVQVERLNAYTVDKNAKLASNMLLTDAERMEIMSKVRDGIFSVKEAMAQVEAREEVLQQAFNEATSEPKEDEATDDTAVTESDATLDTDTKSTTGVDADEGPKVVRDRLSTSVVRSADEGLDASIENAINDQNTELDELEAFVSEEELANNPYAGAPE